MLRKRTLDEENHALACVSVVMRSSAVLEQALCDEHRALAYVSVAMWISAVLGSISYEGDPALI